MSPRLAFSSLLALACLSGTSLAQVAPPPPPADEPAEEFTPPPMPRPRPAPAQRPRQQTTSATLTDELPPFPFPPLYTFCGTEDPKIDDVCTFDSNLHYVALRPNPTIAPSMVPKIQTVIIARRSRMESIVIDNIDVVEDIEGGLVQEISISDPVALQELLERVKPLNPPSNLTQELSNRKILSGTQAKFNFKVISEYQKAYGEYLRRVDPDNATDRFMQQMFNDSLAEALQAYNGMLHESRAVMDYVVDSVDGIPSDAEKALLDLKIDEFKIDPSKIKESAEEVKLAWRPLTLEQKAAFLRAVRQARENADVPPVPTIVVMHAGKTVQKVENGARVLNSNPNARNNEQNDGQNDGGNAEDDG